MRYDTVSLHFTESQTSCTTSSVCRLSGDCYDRTSRPCVHFIIDQMSQSLVVNWTNENRILEFFTTIRIEHNFVSILLISETVDLFRFLLHVKWSEWGSILKELAFQCSHLAD